MNLLEDWHNYLRAQLNTFPFLDKDSISELPIKEIDYIYFNWIIRIIGASPRKVYFSTEFKCPTNLRSGLDILVNKIENGHNLIPHHSRLIKDLDTKDDLLNDWGIYHLHLGENMESDGFVNRNNDLLYLFIDDLNAYLIQTMDHRSFSKRELVKIIHNNWPEVIKKYKMNGIKGVQPLPTDNEVHQLRKGGLNSFVEVDGTVYAPIGGGITSARTSTKATMTTHRYRKMIYDYEDHIKKNMSHFTQHIKNVLGTTPAELIFKLIIDDNGSFYAYEANSNIRFLLK